jgi:hypothetical protein
MAPTVTAAMAIANGTPMRTRVAKPAVRSPVIIFG